MTMTMTISPSCDYGILQCIIARIQRRTLNPLKRLRWTFSRKYLAIFSHYLLLRKAPSKMFDGVLFICPFCLYCLGSVCDGDVV